MTAKTAITKARIEAAFRAVNDGKHPTVTLRDPRVPGLALTIGRASARWTFSFKAPLPGGGWSGKAPGARRPDAMDLDAAREAATAAKAQDPMVSTRRWQAGTPAPTSRRAPAAPSMRRSRASLEERGPDWTPDTRKAFACDFRAISAAIGDVPLAMVDRARLVDLLTGVHIAGRHRSCGRPPA